MNKRAIRTFIFVITLSVNVLNAPTKRHRLAEWIQKQYQYKINTKSNKKDTQKNPCIFSSTKDVVQV